jgi:hypothetical protein
MIPWRCIGWRILRVEVARSRAGCRPSLEAMTHAVSLALTFGQFLLLF